MFYLNVWLTVVEPSNADAVAGALERTGAGSRLEPGCLRWEAYRSQENPAQFLLVEWWESKEHWETHRQGDAVTHIYLKEVIPLVTRQAHPCDKIS